MKIAGLLREVRELIVGERRRAVTFVGDRAYVEVRGISQMDMPRFARALAERCEEVPWVARVEVNPFTRRAGLLLEGATAPEDQICELVAQVEAGLGGGDRSRDLHRERVLPDEGGVELERAIETVADAAALVLGLTLKLVPLFPRRAGSNLHSLMFLASMTPALRTRVEAELGVERTQFALHLATAATQALAQRPLASLVQLGANATKLREVRERRALWERWREKPHAR